MKISIITLFPEVLSPLLNFSILKRAQEKKLVEIELINLRDFGIGPHKTVDDKPYGGGVGMVLKADVLAEAVKLVVSSQQSVVSRKIILTSASGKTYTQAKAKELSKIDHLIIVCGHYEGVDQRFVDKYVDEEISIGDYVLTGGEIPALTITDSIVRLIPGVLSKEEATQLESFEQNLLEHPHYTRPEEFEGIKIPPILISGHHQEVEKWRKEKSVEKTKKDRPDLLES